MPTILLHVIREGRPASGTLVLSRRSHQRGSKVHKACLYYSGNAGRSTTVAKTARTNRIDPHWPEPPTGHSHPVSELASHLQGAQSPFGEITLPASPDELTYSHPITKINK